MKATAFIFEEEGKENDTEVPARAAVDPLAMYFQAIRKCELLTAEEEIALARRIKKEDKQARDAMINMNLRLVVNIAKRRLRRVPLLHLKLADLIAAGNEGLIKAVDRFKPARGCRFSTYATYWIKQTIDREIANCEQTIRNPIHIVDSFAWYNKTVSVLTHELGRTPTVAEIAIKMEKSEAWVEARMKIIKKYVFLDAPLASGDTGESAPIFGDLIEGSDGTEAYRFALHSAFKKKFADVFERVSLSEQEKEVLCLRYGIGSDDGEGLTLDKIGIRLGLTREWIRQIEARALGKFRKAKHLNYLRDLL
ncbi:RNA polymerase sigma factor RpoD/SigA [Candidatus Azambacteria bacterium]|nr:RNA polymerase sigma factor RpoD/SigA [Candidatus Azambacteria bacterium]